MKHLTLIAVILSFFPVLTSGEELSLPDLIGKCMPAVVSIRAERLLMPRDIPPAPGGITQRPSFEVGVGAGFLIDREGIIATMRALVRDARKIDVIFADGRRAVAELMGEDGIANVALLKVDPGAVEGIDSLRFSDRPPRIGQTVIALGNPRNLGISAFRGIVSGLDRTPASEFIGLIQTDITAFPGMGGGPLIDEEGGVIGMCSVALREGPPRPMGRPSTAGLLFAVPADLIRRAISIMRGEAKGWGYLGAMISDSKEERGVVVNRVLPGSPAQEAGFESGDLILELNGEPVLNAAQFRRMILTAEPGEEVVVKVLREGRELVLKARIGERGG